MAISISVSVRVAPADCWNCGCVIGIVSALRLERAGSSLDCSVADLTEYPELAREIESAVPASADIGPLRPRFSGTRSATYMSNGCRHCGAIFGNFYEFGTRYEEEEVALLSRKNDGNWATFLNALEASEDGHLFR